MAVDCTNDIFELSMIARLDLKGEKHNGTGDAMVEEEAVHSAMDINKGITSIKVGSSSEEAVRETETVNSTMDYLTQEFQVAVTGVLPRTSAHDQPLLLCINEMHSVKTIGGPSKIL